MANLIRVKQLDQPDLSGFFNTAFVNTGILDATFVDKFTDENISGVKTFIDGINLNNIDNLNLSGVDIIITSGNIALTNRPTVNGTGVALNGELNNTGILLNNRINSLSGLFTGYTGTLDATFASDIQLANTGSTLDRKINNLSGVSVLTFGNQTINGVKTFASFPTVNETGIVYTLGNQDVSGQKRFVDQDIVSTIAFNSLNQPSTFIGGFSGPGVYRFEVKPEYRPVVFPNPNYFYTGVNPGQPVEIYFNTGTSRWWYTVNNIFTDASPIVQASSSSARLPLSNWSGGNMRIYPTYIHNISHYIDGNDPIDVDSINGVAKTGAQTISGVKTFANSGIFSLSGITPLNILNNPLSVVGSGNSYLQLNIQNRATGTTATADLVITANNGTDTTNYINLGINNFGYNDPTFSNGSGLDGYLFINGGNLDIGTQTLNTQIEFHVGGTTAIRTVARLTSDGLNIVSGGLTASNVVYNTGDQNISGVKTFNLQPILSGNPLITGNLSLYGTAANLSSTGSNLDARINSLSGSAVLTTGNQLISGVKTFFDSGIFSNGGASAVPLLNNPLSIVGSGTGYVQVNIQNRGTGFNASADLVITANNGTDNSNFINLGINNIGYNDPAFTNGTGLDGYLFIDGGNLDIGTRTSGKVLEFHAGGTTAGSTIARISQSGLNVVSGNLTVNNTGVLLSGQNSFILNFISNQASTNASLSYFGNFPAGYGNDAVSRAFPVLENCTARKIVFSTQLGSTFDVPFTTGYFINTTQNITGTIPVTISPAVVNTLYNYVGNINVPINTGDNVVCLLKTTGVIPTFRSVVQVYCYN